VSAVATGSMRECNDEIDDKYVKWAHLTAYLFFKSCMADRYRMYLLEMSTCRAAHIDSSQVSRRQMPAWTRQARLSRNANKLIAEMEQLSGGLTACLYGNPENRFRIVAFRRTLVDLFEQDAGWPADEFAGRLYRRLRHKGLSVYFDPPTDDGVMMPVADVLAQTLTFATRTCAGCGQVPEGGRQALMKCGTCKNSWYCSKACQVSDWPRHKAACRTLAASPDTTTTPQPSPEALDKISACVR